MLLYIKSINISLKTNIPCSLRKHSKMLFKCVLDGCMAATCTHKVTVKSWFKWAEWTVPGRSTWGSRRRSSWLRRYQTLRSSSVQRTESPAAAWRRTRIRPPPPATHRKRKFTVSLFWVYTENKTTVSHTHCRVRLNFNVQIISAAYEKYQTANETKA